MNHDLEALSRTKDIRKAEMVLARDLKAEHQPESKARLLLMRAKLRLLSGRYQESLEDLRESAALYDFSTTAEFMEVSGDAHFQAYEHAKVGFVDRAQLKLAESAYLSIVRHHPRYTNIGWIHYQLGRLRLISGEAKLAEAEFQTALFAPSYVPSLTAYCFERLAFIAMYETRDYYRALGLIDKAVVVYPAEEPPVWLIQAHLLRSKILQYLDLSLAFAAAKTAHQLAHQHGAGTRAVIGDTLLIAAEIASKMKNHERECIELLEQFIAVSRTPPGVDVTWSRIHELLGNARYALGQYDAAIAAYHSMLHFNPYHPWDNSIYNRIAQCHYNLSQYEKAVEVAQSVIQNPDTSEAVVAYELLVKSYLAMRKDNEAQQASARLAKLKQSVG
jgi:tetratricopeptide (TPR) repeat protein